MRDYTCALRQKARTGEVTLLTLLRASKRFVCTRGNDLTALLLHKITVSRFRCPYHRPSLNRRFNCTNDEKTGGTYAGPGSQQHTERYWSAIPKVGVQLFRSKTAVSAGSCLLRRHCEGKSDLLNNSSWWNTSLGLMDSLIIARQHTISAMVLAHALFVKCCMQILLQTLSIQCCRCTAAAVYPAIREAPCG